ncbi:MAG: type I-E CRISPR-associated protein Cas6/Cse3/CasE [Synergistaceae bacterium]|nr:type I-E CRISPR-associated protein Cas6/Cse3/CasE [Synergistaceae bacterium]MBQ9903450.1 type I-E CRISPR-associated protein Cas6/Cse3/CasE [Synergistaceae bacterium]
MFLSRIPLDVDKRETRLALNSPNIFHGSLEFCFPGERKRKLWRIDRLNGILYLLVLSDESPDLSTFCKRFGLAENAWETKDYDVLLKRLENGSLWRFRLTANPTKSAAQQDRTRGTVYAHITTEFQRKWLLDRADKHGFQISEDGFDVVESKWEKFEKSKGCKVTILSVTYEGILKITDVSSFSEVLLNGMGRGKAYGMGLLTVVHL